MEIREKVTFQGDELKDFDDWFVNYTDEDNDTVGNDGLQDLCDLRDRMHFKATFIPVLYSLVFVVGVLGNGALLGVLFRSRRVWSVTDTFILHLCVADVLLLFTLPLWASEAVDGWTFGTPLCKITGAMFTINIYCGIFLLVCISLDRYLSIVHATQMYSRRNPCVVQCSCILVWFFSLLLSVPDWIFLNSMLDERRNITECAPNYRMFGQDGTKAGSMVTSLISQVVGFLLPSIILIFCYSCILHRLRCGTHGLQKQRASRVIIAVVAVFLLCWAPYNITLMVKTFTSDSNNNQTCDETSRMERAIFVTSTLGYLHCSLNPILYAFVGVKFRRQLIDILGSLGCIIKSRVHRPSMASSRKSSVWSESRDTSNSTAI